MATARVLPDLRANGHRFDRAPYLDASHERARLSVSAMKGFLAIVDKWEISELEARTLLGGIASSTFHGWKTRPDSTKLGQDTLMRISLLIGIYKALHIYFSDEWADRWISLGNRAALFSGESPLRFMIQHGQPGMVDVRRTLDSWRGGR